LLHCKITITTIIYENNNTNSAKSRKNININKILCDSGSASGCGHDSVGCGGVSGCVVGCHGEGCGHRCGHVMVVMTTEMVVMKLVVTVLGLLVVAMKEDEGEN
jgi:hypothetical protein